MKKKVKRYQEGGEAELKARGLESSKGDKVSFLERLRMGNIDDPSSEAYRRLGAGRAKMDIEAKTTVPEMSSDYSGRGAKSYSDDGMNVPHSSAVSSDEEGPRTLAKYMRSSPKEDSVTVEEKEEVKIKPKAKPKKKSLSGMFGSIDEEAIKERSKVNQPTKKEPMYDLAKAGRALADTFSSERATKRYAESTPYARSKMGMKSGGKVSSASSRADGIAQRGKTKGRIC